MFGRSIGGISACHLAAKYNDLVELMLIDRSMNEVFEIMSHKLIMSTLTNLLYYFFKGWNCNNSSNYVKANKCFKIVTCDPMDDTVG